MFPLRFNRSNLQQENWSFFLQRGELRLLLVGSIHIGSCKNGNLLSIVKRFFFGIRKNNTNVIVILHSAITFHYTSPIKQNPPNQPIPHPCNCKDSRGCGLLKPSTTTRLARCEMAISELHLIDLKTDLMTDQSSQV